MMMRLLVAAAVLAACHHGHGGADAKLDARLEGFDKPDIVCPGGPVCASAGDGVLKVGAAKRTYTPQNFETYCDENGDRQWEPTEPYGTCTGTPPNCTCTDPDGNGKFDGVWLFGGGRAALGVTTDVEARAMAFVEGDMTFVVLYVDCIGLLVGDMDLIRNDPRLAALNIDHIIIGATHAHDAPDTVGLWGPSVTGTGREPFVMQAIYDQSVAAITEAVQTAQPAHLVIASTKLVDTSLTAPEWNQDIRDPIIYDPTLTIARFVKVSDPTMTIGTLVNWADHPEVAHFDDTVPATITAHYPHWLRDHVEQGVMTTESVFAQQNLAGLGGVTVFVQGALGGQIGSLRGTSPPGPGGTPITKESAAMDQAIGTNAAARALTALRDTGETVSDLPLSLVSAKFNAEMDNTGFQLEFILGVLGPHPLVGYDPNQQVGDGNQPWLPLRATYLQIGPLGIVTVPGELHPELWVGGYDGSWSQGWPLINHPTQPNQPDFSMAPPPPYMRDLVLAKPGVRYPVVAGLAEDYIGYIVPAYNYVLDANDPYISRAPGDHYEETYSLGPLVEQHAVDPILQLLQYHQ